MARGFSPPALAAFELAFRPWMRRRLRAIRVFGPLESLPRSTPLLLVANHVSWWDPFLLREVHRRLRPHGPLYSIMLQRELEQRSFFRRIGALGIDPAQPTTVARAIRELERRVQEHPASTIAFFPQGRIWPSHRRPLGFRRGVELLTRRLRPLIVLPVAIHLEPLNTPAPAAFLHLGRPARVGSGGASADLLEDEVTAGLDAIHAFLNEHGEDALRAELAPVHPRADRIMVTSAEAPEEAAL